MGGGVDGGGDWIYLGIERLKMGGGWGRSFSIDDLGEMGKIWDEDGVKS